MVRAWQRSYGNWKKMRRGSSNESWIWKSNHYVKLFSCQDLVLPRLSRKLTYPLSNWTCLLSHIMRCTTNARTRNTQDEAARRFQNVARSAPTAGRNAAAPAPSYFWVQKLHPAGSLWGKWG